MDFATYLNQYYNNSMNSLNQAEQTAKGTAQSSFDQQLTGLQNTFNQNKLAVDQQRVDTRDTYRDKINDSSVDLQLQQKRLNEVLAKQGYTQGDTGQAMLSNNINRANAIGGLQRQESKVYDNLNRTLTGYETDFNNNKNTLSSTLSQQLAELVNQYAQKKAELNNDKLAKQYEYEQTQAAAAKSASRSSGSSGGSSKTLSATDMKKNFDYNLNSALESGNIYSVKSWLDEYGDEIKSNYGYSTYNTWLKKYNDALKGYKGTADSNMRSNAKSTASPYGGGRWSK